MIRKTLSLTALLGGILLLQSCCGPAVTGGYSNGMPIATTETHTKTVQPASFSMPYVPPASVYQAAPMAVSQPVQAPICQPVQFAAPQPVTYQANPCPPVSYQASPVCPPSYQSPQYTADPCAPYGYATPNVRYNMVGTANPVQPQYIVVQPTPAQYAAPMHIQSNARAPDHCDEVKP